MMKNSFNIVLNDEDEEEKKEDKKAGADPLAEKFLKTRQIILSGEINKELAEKIVRDLLMMEADSSEPIRMYIDSPGGDVEAGFAIFDMIRFINAPVTLIGMGLVASAAALILLAVPKERRVALLNSQSILHQRMSGIRGGAKDNEIHAQELAKTRAKLNKIISEATGKDIEQVTKDTDRDYWLTADEAIEYGLVSRIIRARSDLN